MPKVITGGVSIFIPLVVDLTYQGVRRNLLHQCWDDACTMVVCGSVRKFHLAEYFDRSVLVERCAVIYQFALGHHFEGDRLLDLNSKNCTGGETKFIVDTSCLILKLVARFVSVELKCDIFGSRAILADSHDESCLSPRAFITASCVLSEVADLNLRWKGRLQVVDIAVSLPILSMSRVKKYNNSTKPH